MTSSELVASEATDEFPQADIVLEESDSTDPSTDIAAAVNELLGSSQNSNADGLEDILGADPAVVRTRRIVAGIR